MVASHFVTKTCICLNITTLFKIQIPKDVIQKISTHDQWVNTSSSIFIRGKDVSRIDIRHYTEDVDRLSGILVSVNIVYKLFIYDVT